MADETLQVVITASIQQLTDALGEASQSVTDALNSIQGSAQQVASTLDGEMSEGAQKASESLDSIKEHAETSAASLETLQEVGKKALEFFGIAAGIEALHQLGEAFTEAAEHAESLENVSKMTGIAIEQLQGLEAISSHVGVSSQTLDRGLMKLNTTLLMAQEGSAMDAAYMQNLGVSMEQINDPSTNLSTVLETVVENIHKTGLNSQTAGELQQVFGLRAGQLSLALEGLNGKLSNASEIAKEMGAPTQEQIELLEQWKQRTADLHTEFTNLAERAFSELATQLFTLGQQIKDMIGDSISWSDVTDTLTNVFRGFVIVIEIIIGVVKTVLDLFIDLIKMARDLAEALGALLTLNFAAAKQAWAGYASDVKEAMDDIKRNAEATGTAMQNTALGTTPGAPEKKEQAPEGGGEAIHKTAGGKKSKMGEWETALEEQKAAQGQMSSNDGQYHEFSKEQELAYWKNILDTEKTSSEEKLALRKKIAGLELDIQKNQTAAQLEALKNQEAQYKSNVDAKLAIAQQYADKVAEIYGKDSKEYESAAKEVVAIEKQKSDQLLAIQKQRQAAMETQKLAEISVSEKVAQMDYANQKITTEQLLQLEKQFEQQRLQIQIDGINQEIQAEKNNPDRNPAQVAKLYAEIEKLKAAHNEKMMQLDAKFQAANKKQWDTAMKPITHAFETNLKGMMHGTMTFEKAYKNMWKSMEDQAIQSIMNILTQHLTAELAKTAASEAGATARIAADTTASTASTAMTAKSAITNITTKAAEVIANVYTSVASIPVIGAFLAPALAFAAGALVIGLIGRVASAAGGWEVPHDQLAMVHEDEMILPAGISRGLKGLIASGGNGSGGGKSGGVQFNVNAIDQRGVAQFLQKNGSGIAKTLNQQVRRFNSSTRMR